jgi:predicted acyltransferase
MWIRTVRRGALLVVLGWILCYFRDQFAYSLYGQMRWTIKLGMDVLQLLGLGYLVARIIYEVPAIPRFVVAAGLLIYHWALLRFYPQPPLPAGTFFVNLNALQYIYEHWTFWRFINVTIGPLSIGWKGLMSVPPAAATMVLGTLIGDWLRREEVLPAIRAKRLAIVGGIGMVLGILWAFSLPFNKPVWTPSYLVYVCGFDALCIAMLYWLIDLSGLRKWSYPLIVFGTNALALYFLSIMIKVLLLNTPRIHGSRLIDILLTSLKSNLGNWAGGWTFTILYIGFWWLVMDQFYRRKIFWKL